MRRARARRRSRLGLGLVHLGLSFTLAVQLAAVLGEVGDAQFTQDGLSDGI